MDADARQFWRHARWVWPLIHERRREAAKLVLLSAVASALVLSQPFLIRLLIDQGAIQADLEVIAWVCGGMVAASLIGLGIESISRFDYLALSSHVLFRLRERLFGQLQSLPPTFYARVGQGDILARFDGDLTEVQRFFVDGALALINALFTLLLGIVVMWSLSPPLALVALAIAPFQIAASLGMRTRIEQASRDVRDQSTRLSGHFLDSLRALKFVQSTNTESLRLAGLRHHHDRYYGALKENLQVNFHHNALHRVVGMVGTTTLYGGAGLLLARGSISVGVLVACVVLSSRVAAPIQTLVGTLSGWQRCRVSLRRLADIPSPEVHPGDKGFTPAHLNGDIVFDRVTFGYDPERCILDAASMRIPAGSKTLLVGPSGEGKTTIIDLLLGHLRPQRGTIRIAGLALERIDRAWLRQRIAVVDQEPVFFSGSIRQNLLHVRAGASDQELLDALTASGYAPASAAPDVLDTPVGASTFRLSRGQRMRLALARAMLQRPEILILDETTTAVDADMARRMMESVDRLFADATRIVITHQPALAGACDRAYILRDGRILSRASVSETASADRPSPDEYRVTEAARCHVS